MSKVRQKQFLQDQLERVRKGWIFRGQRRPGFARTPLAGQESVWDFPRPPRIEEDLRNVAVFSGETLLAKSTCTLRVLETASPPTYYIPRNDIDMNLLKDCGGTSVCEWKGKAKYLSFLETPQAIAWFYPEPFEDFSALRDHVSFYPGRVPCFLNGESVRSQPGEFYGGWITEGITGPFKGDCVSDPKRGYL